MMQAVLQILGHELTVILRTRRALAVSGLYLAVATVGGLVYVLAARSFEAQSIEAAIAQGLTAEQAAEAVASGGRQIYEALVGWAAGTPFDQMAPSLRESPVLPVFLWCSLAFLPFLVMITSFDQMSAELGSRSICYSLLRVRRAELILGKLGAHVLLYIVVMVASSTVLILLANVLLHGSSLFGSLAGLLRLWLLLIPYGFAYLGITAFSSATTRHAGSALLGAVAIAGVLRCFAWIGSAPDDHPLAVLQFLAWFSPVNYHEGFWQSGVFQPLVSAFAYVAIGSYFSWVAIWSLGRRDI